MAMTGTQFKMTITADGKMTRQPSGKAGKKSSGTWKLDTSGFRTSWKGAETNCYTVVVVEAVNGLPLKNVA